MRSVVSGVVHGAVRMRVKGELEMKGPREVFFSDGQKEKMQQLIPVMHTMRRQTWGGGILGVFVWMLTTRCTALYGLASIVAPASAESPSVAVAGLLAVLSPAFQTPSCNFLAARWAVTSTDAECFCVCGKDGL